MVKGHVGNYRITSDMVDILASCADQDGIHPPMHAPPSAQEPKFMINIVYLLYLLYICMYMYTRHWIEHIH